jgi:hypothetical protein
MIAPRIQEALVDSSTLEVLSKVLLILCAHGISPKHLSKGIALVLKPKLIMPLDVLMRHIEVRIVLRVIKDLVISLGIEGAGRLLDLASEPVIPALKAKMGSLWIAYKVIIIDPF